MERNEFLNSVFGYKKIKDELYEIRSWYLSRNLNEEERKEFLPKGILFLLLDQDILLTLLSNECHGAFKQKIL